MKNHFIPVIGAVSLTALLFGSGAAYAADAADLAQKSGCVSCHSVDKKMVGPAFKDISKKYKDTKDAEAMMVKKIKDGSSGVWGPVPMPANSPKVSDADIKTLAAWILSL